MTLSDDAFLEAFEACTLPAEAFRHANHVRLAWIYLRRAPCDEASKRMERSIRDFAAHHGASQKYHHTLTGVWMRLVAEAVARTPEIDAFEAFLGTHPHLGDKGLPYRYYTPQRLDSDAARAGWVEPDLLPLPATGSPVS